jgi:hypothetical protein
LGQASDTFVYERGNTLPAYLFLRRKLKMATKEKFSSLPPQKKRNFFEFAGTVKV